MRHNAEHGFIIGGHFTPSNKSDTKELKEMVAESGVKKSAMVFADKGYASAENRWDLEDRRITDGIISKAARGRQLTGPERLMNRVISGLR